MFEAIRNIDNISKVAIVVCFYAIIRFFVTIFYLGNDVTYELINGAWIGVFVSGVVLFLVNRIITKSQKSEQLRNLFLQFQANTSAVIEVQHDLSKLDKEEFGDRFYRNLFDRNPELQPLFSRVPLEKQTQTLINMVEYLIQRSTDEDIVPELQKLSKRHIDFGVKKEYYDKFEKCISDTLMEMKVQNVHDWILIFKMYARVMKSVY